MDAESWARARAIFDQLVDLPDTEWHTRLDALGLDGTLRDDVLALLRADRIAGIETAVDAQAPQMLSDLAGTESDAQNASLVGQTVGAFRLIREIGRGGMGTVWLADRVDGEFEQQVAIKLIRAGWDAGEVDTRFRAERQILAGLTHPNIARLIDGGVTTDGRPWLALEYVDGVDLRTFCERGKLDLRERLRLFQTVCAAVSHAHARLVVHRDLKPSNLLVTRTGEVKLLDFGIAKLIDGSAANASQTRVFTPEYAAPEQVRGEPVTTAVDVHALGLLLYELLTGKRPYKVNHSTPAAYERAILDQEPTRPSQVWTRDADAGNTATAEAGELSARRLARELRGDLDAIVLKALRKNPADRYASVADFTLDIDNHLQRRPVVARRGGWRYQATRFVRRHALAFSLSGVALIALIGGLGVAIWQAHEARQQRDIARSETAKATQTRQFLLDIFRSADPALTKGRQVTAQELLERGAQRIAQQRFADPGVHFDLLMAIGEASLGIGAGADALKYFEQAVHLQQTELADDVLKRVRALTLLARSRGSTDDFTGAATLLDEVDRLLPAEHAESELAADIAVVRGINSMSLGDITGSIAHMARGVELFRRHRGVADDQTASAAITLSWAYDDQDRHAEARVMLEPIVAALRAAPDASPVRLADALDALANTYTAASEAQAAAQMRQQALDITRRVYGESHGYVEIRLNNLSFSLLRAHDYAGANAAMKQALALRMATEPPGSRRIGTSLNNLASTEYALGNWADAERLWTQALDIRRKGTDITDVAFTLSGSAGAAREQGRLDDARSRIDESLQILRAHPSPKPSHLARVLIERVEVDLAQDIVECAGAEEAIALLQTNVPGDDPQRLYADVVAAGCAFRAAASQPNRDRVNAAQLALRAQFPADSARVRQAQRYALAQ